MSEIELLNQQLLAAQQQVGVMWIVIAIQFVIMAIAMIFLARTAPPGLVADMFKLASGVVAPEVARALSAKMEADAKITADTRDDLVASITKAVVEKLYPSVPTAPLNPPPSPEVNVTVTTPAQG
jgi:hypothetical protein